MSKEPKSLFNSRMEEHPFAASLIFAAACNFSHYIFYILFIFIIMPLMQAAGIPADGIGFPVGRIILAVLLGIRMLSADVFYAIKAQSRLGFPIWFIGIPILFVLFSLTPHNDFFSGFRTDDICTIYFYRLLPFALVRTYSYPARDERRKKYKAEISGQASSPTY